MKNSNKNSLLKEFKETLISKKYNKYGNSYRNYRLSFRAIE